MKEETDCKSDGSLASLEIRSIPFSEIPGQSRLFVEYQKDPLSLRRFYPSAVASHTQIAERIPTVLENYRTDRDKLCSALLETNKKFGAGEATLANIEMLREPDAVAVVSGQQAGLFSGPLYTVYKALSAVRMAECLKGRGYKAVPVFWVATEDHDFEEVSNAFVIDRRGDVAELRNEPKRCYQDLPVGYIKLDDSIDDTIDELFRDLAVTEFTDEVRSLIKECWRSGEYFGDAFGRLLTMLLGEYGLVILCPLNNTLKELAAPIYVEAIKRSKEIVDALQKRSSELTAAGYQAQVLVNDDYFPLFWQATDDTRNALKKSKAGTFRTKDGLREFTLHELAEIAAHEPHRFSPSVVLRSVVQDYILPTVCYFGGGAEIAYFAQSSEVYRILDRPPTPILHRQSFTVIETKHAKTASRYGISFEEILGGMDTVMSRIAEEYLNKDAAELFTAVEENIDSELHRLDEKLARIDSTLSENLSRRRKKILFHIAAMRHKFHQAEVRRDEIVERRLSTFFSSLTPRGALQERSINVLYFLDRYGMNFIDWIYDAIDLDDKGHRLIYL